MRRLLQSSFVKLLNHSYLYFQFSQNISRLNQLKYVTFYNLYQRNLIILPKYEFAKVGKKKLEKQEKTKEKQQSNLSDTIDLLMIENKFKDHLQTYKDSLQKMKVGKFTPDILDPLQINCYGKRQSLNQIAQISAKAVNVLQVNIFDEALVNDVCKALENSSLNIQIKKEGKIITCTQLGGNTKELKIEMVKKLKSYLESSKINNRKLRSEGMDYVQKKLSFFNQLKPFKKSTSEDTIKTAEKEIEQIYNKFLLQLDELAKLKEKELMNS